jgi:hypothetical protein
LITIEKKHHISFNYIENDIIFFKIIPPKSEMSLLEKINYIHDQTQLDFENIDNQFINIFKSNNLNSTKISGYIYSLEDNLPIENATIQNSNGLRISTNQNGYFEFKNQKYNDITISCLGFATKKIIASDFQNKKYLKISLESKANLLDAVNASNFLTSGIYKKTNGVIEIKPKKLGILPGLIEADVLQVMQQIPGVNSVDESVASINVRGGTHDQNLFLWNGIKMYQTGHFFGLISSFNPNLANTISISKNGSSPFYGESVSSVVNILSNPSKFEKNNFSAGINMINADASLKYNINKKGFIEVAGRKSITDLVKSPTYNQYFNKAFQNSTITDLNNNQEASYSNNEKFNFYDATFKYFQKIGQKNVFILDLITIKDKFNVIQENTFKNTITSENNTLYQTNYGGNLSFARNWNAHNSSKINMNSSFYELDAEKDKIQSDQIVKQENKVLDNTIKLENNHFLNSKYTFNNGFQFTEMAVTNIEEISKPKFLRKDKAVLRTYALVLEAKYKDTVSRVNLNIGLRANYIEQFKKHLFEPRLQFNYGLTKLLNLEVLGELKSQYSFQIIDFQNDYFGIEKRRWILADDNAIPIQKSKQISFGLSYTKNNWLVTLEKFYKKVTGINSSGQGFQNQLEIVRINGDYKVLGAEILVQKKVNHFITWLSYAYNNNNYYFADLKEPIFSNNFELDHVVSWAGIYENDNFKIALGSKWHSGRPETNPINYVVNIDNILNPNINYNTPNNTKLDSFFQVNFSTTYKWKSLNGALYKLGFSLLNIFNRNNEINEYYRINNVSNSIEEVKTFAIKRTPNLNFRINF